MDADLDLEQQNQPRDYHLEDSLGLGNSKPILSAIKRSLSKDNECCGVFYIKDDLDYDFLEFNNENKINPNYFSFNNKKFYELYLNNKIIALFHSHTKDFDETPSIDDIEVAESLSLPSMIFSIKTKGQFVYFPKSQKPVPLERRIFIPYFQDCVTFIKDFFYFKFNIKLQDFVFNWARKRSDPNQYLIEEMNKVFTEVEDINKYDILVTKPSTSHLFHLCIYEGENTIYHHPIGAYPRKELFTPESLNKVYKVYRYKDL
jgi:proteasome lid subunit RPN8/RPN11